MTARTLLLTCGEPVPAHLAPFEPRLHSIDIYQLECIELFDYTGLLVPAHADQRFLAAQQHALCRFLENGGTLVMCGQVSRPFLPELAPFVPLSGRSVEEWRVWRVAEHPVFDGVTVDDLTFRRGVAGFYGRGHMPPPRGAAIIHRLGGSDGAPVDYVYEPATGGRVLVHAGNDLWSYATESDSTASRIPSQLLDWLESPLGGGGAR